MRRRSSRISWRDQGGIPRAYGDFRDFADVGGKREALIPAGAKKATADPDVAATRVADRLEELERRRRGKDLIDDDREQETTLEAYAAYHLMEKARSKRVTTAWLASTEQRLRTAIEFLGADRVLKQITVKDIQHYVNHLRAQPNRRGGTFTDGNLHHYLRALSNLYRRAQAEKEVPVGYCPVSALMEKPQIARDEAKWLEVHDAALLLEAARHYVPRREDLALPFAYPLVATFLLTGGRSAEIRGLHVDDVSFDRRTVTFRPHAHRRLKTLTSFRPVPLWPQLEEILRQYLFGGEMPRTTGLLFPSEDGTMVVDLRKLFDGVAGQAGWKKGEIRTKMLRHTYCSARLQTTDQGVPVSPFTVARELGHGGDALVRKVYGHLGTVRHRSEVVEYHAELFADQLGTRLVSARSPRRYAQCQGTTTTGTPCRERTGLSPDGLCLWHDPVRGEEARRARPHARLPEEG